MNKKTKNLIYIETTKNVEIKYVNDCVNVYVDNSTLGSVCQLKKIEIIFPIVFLLKKYIY